MDDLKKQHESNLQRLQESNTALLQTLRSFDIDSDEFRELVSRIHNLCDLHEQAKINAAAQWALDLKIYDKILELIEEAQSIIRKQGTPAQSADDQSEGEDAQT